jgi:hypothetical protein
MDPDVSAPTVELVAVLDAVEVEEHLLGGGHHVGRRR